MKFKEYSFSEKILQGIRDAGFEECMPVQDATFVYTLAGKDVCVQSQTGTGKTVAFLVTIYQLMMEHESYKNVTALIIVPTRELAVQIETEAHLLGSHLPFRIGCFYGGVGYAQQEKLIDRGVDIIIGTPGRLIDFNTSRMLDFSNVRILVIDEADRLFDMGFYPDLRRMLHRMPRPEERMTMLFSATLGDDVKRLARDHMNSPGEITIMPEKITVEQVTQKLYHVGRQDKFSLLLGILKKVTPGNALIFTNTKRAAVEVAKRLELNGINCEYIMGDLPQSSRLKIIDGIKSGKVRFLVATNVAARGLHIDDLDLVVNYDLPFDSEDYVHRIGRTARAGKTGLAISLACPEFVYGLEAIEEFTRMKIPVEWPDEDMFVEDKSAGIRIRRTEHAGRREKTGKRPARGERNKRPEREKKEQGAFARNEQARPKHEKKKTGARRDEQPKREKQSARDKKEKSASVRHEKQIAHEKKPREKNSENIDREKIKKMSAEERLEYYSKKYGEKFEVVYDDFREESPKKHKKILKKIKNLFTRNKKSPE